MFFSHLFHLAHPAIELAKDQQREIPRFLASARIATPGSVAAQNRQFFTAFGSGWRNAQRDQRLVAREMRASLGNDSSTALRRPLHRSGGSHRASKAL